MPRLTKSVSRIICEEIDRNCRLLVVPLFRGSSRFESLIYHTIPGGKLHVSVMNEDKADNLRGWKGRRVKLKKMQGRALVPIQRVGCRVEGVMCRG